MSENVLQLDPRDNVLVALATLEAGTTVHYGPSSSPASCGVTRAIPAKHKMALVDLKPGDLIFLYGMVVGEVVEAIPCGGLLTTRNIRHRTGDYSAVRQPVSIAVPDASAWAGRTFMGYLRADGQVGTRNYWIVLPLVFCENRNVERMKEALEEELGYGSQRSYRQHVRQLIEQQRNGGALAASYAALAANDMATTKPPSKDADRVFPNVDGIRFLTHQGGCGGTRQDAQALCGLLAGYIHHPNVAGATVLSLGCQNAQTRAGFRSAEIGTRIDIDEPCAGPDFCRTGRGQPHRTQARATFRFDLGDGVWRIGWIQRNLCQSHRWLCVRPCGRCGRQDNAVGVSRTAWRGAGTDQSLHVG
jgi:altronate hydrolase